MLLWLRLQKTYTADKDLKLLSNRRDAAKLAAPHAGKTPPACAAQQARSSMGAERADMRIWGMRILVAEDDPSIGEALCVAFQGQGFVVELAASGNAADAALQNEAFDLVILDLGLPALDGFQVLQRLRGRSHSVPVIILSANSTLDSRVRGLDLGADDFVCKPFSLAELRARVQALLRRAADALDEPAAGPVRFDTETRRLFCDGQPIALSARETGMIEVMWKQFGRPVRKELLLDHSYDFAADASINAVEVCIHRLRRKLEGTPITVRTVPGAGYALENRLH